MKGIIEVSNLTFKSEVVDSAVPVLVDFWAPWCGPCGMVEPSLDVIARRYKGRAKVVKINADQNPELMEQYAVRGLPTVMLFSRGQAQRTKLGVRSRQEYQSLLDEALEPLPEQTGPLQVVTAASASGSSS